MVANCCLREAELGDSNGDALCCDKGAGRTAESFVAVAAAAAAATRTMGMGGW